MKKTVWFKDWIWYYHFLLFIVFLSFLIWGMYISVFKEHWYLKDSQKPVALLNYEILLSFYSVQVNIITIVWLLFYLVNVNKRNYGVNSSRFRLTIMNLNLIVFMIFWIGVIVYMKDDPQYLTRYSQWQIICTVVTHFICPLSLMIIYFFVAGKEKYGYLDIWKFWDIYIVAIYSFLYMIYIYIRGQIYGADGIEVMQWPYPFLDFDNLLIGDSIIGYMVLITIVFVIWIYLNHVLLIFTNNRMFNILMKSENRQKQALKDRKI